MEAPLTDQRPIVAVGGVVLKGDQVLLIQRGRPPLRKHWSIPGGKIEYGEDIRTALVREIEEETGVTCEPIGLIGVFEALPKREGDRHYVMVDYACRYISGEVTPGDDAMDAEWLSLPEALSRVAWDETRRAVQGALKFAKEAK
ncbi:NUDIX hydrolase [Parvularcula lutaonensis]|uniref:NUDIX hydrolase n=1 Tax=Parvularcula lutaonensis TaxID=491923 RepID=A0ABV7MCZ2_9PROT|nr:NUDIX hydrolase [Parvularcula lutaonensis]GGY50075.1 DNA mismatch repair protein MutT [Parvularcula lutaonensis]